VIRRVYGASPLHLAGHLALFVVAAYALGQALDVRAAANFALWFCAAIVLHDLVLLPAYSAVDRSLQRAAPRAVNFVRFPAAISAVLLLAYFPLVLGRADANFMRAAGYTPSGYLGRWLAVTVALFALSGVACLIASRRPAASRRSGP
jgi:hypothetical protein